MSENNNISSLFDRSGNLTPDAMERYLLDQLTAEEKAGVDSQLAASPFDREALEGMEKNTSRKIRKDLEELDTMVMALAREKARITQPHRIKYYYWAAAAGLVGLVGLTVVLVFMFRSPSEQQLAVSSQQSAVSGQDSGTVGTSGTLELSAVSSRQSAVSGQDSVTIGTSGTLELLAVNNQRSAVSGQDSGTIGTSGTLELSAVSSQQSAVSGQDSGTVGTSGTLELSAPVDVIEYDVVADNMVEYEAMEIIVEDEVTAEQEIVTDEAPVAILHEVQTVGGVRVNEQKRTGASKKAMEDHYQVSGNALALSREDTTAEEISIFMVVESMPEFPGGEEAFIKYLADSLHYPAAAMENSIQGKVFVTFIVEKDGSVSDARILRGIGGGCDEEALRVIQNMPKWIPGKQRGKPVRVQYNLPIKFSLSGTSN